MDLQINSVMFVIRPRAQVSPNAKANSTLVLSLHFGDHTGDLVIKNKNKATPLNDDDELGLTETVITKRFQFRAC